MTLPNIAEKNFSTDLIISRELNAPRDKVFQAWTKSRHLIHWWGPKGFTMPSHKMDIHPGGMYRCDLKAPDGKDHWAQGVFREMIEPSHLAFSHSWEEDGASIPETFVTVELTEKNEKTVMIFHQSGFKSENQRDSHNDGWSQSFDRLENYLANSGNTF
ncbi:MAG: polyketide cyclase [Micavibrio aeruginosavorus]|uniref:Polyketide cyclase n=1 Tax=Micavibrio aeruginosavorus TaxID=349221 RepID=A0A2W5HPJ4_9BACT|nr:MAG: polyketide cyclase [Micavibrio aeruginosavorus]